MLGRKDYEAGEIADARKAVGEQLAVYRSAGSTGDLETTYFTTALVALDRRFVHRVRTFTGKDTNPLSEVEVLVDSLIDDGGILQAGSVVRYQPEKSVLGLAPGDPVVLRADDFERLAGAFLDAVEARSAS
jgi:hypothetical protein